ncbi:hypothetical protein NDU88_004921 [Pleurodeles waltl]|uniref:Uncharacterized protein n=1 Tax=Pleurodeles waltl TaxID=8319 RepID=A0AAV7M7P7_PLEWA|nr:hypothetical protein NDU88_004921 [Pleurodeles waltl]
MPTPPHREARHPRSPGGAHAAHKKTTWTKAIWKCRSTLDPQRLAKQLYAKTTTRSAKAAVTNTVQAAPTQLPLPYKVEVEEFQRSTQVAVQST